MSERLSALARRVEDDPDFLAAALAAYARSENLSDADLARRLGCLPSRLPALRLCRSPRTDPEQFQADIDRIAAAFAIDGGIITEAVRLADSLRALGGPSLADGYLMAARDRSPDGSSEDTDGEDVP